MSVLFGGFLLGLLGGVVPGSVLTILLVSVLQGGFKSGMRAFLWCVVAEIAIVLILLSLILSLPLSPNVFSYIGLIGGVVLMYFSSQVIGLSKVANPQETGEVFSGPKIFLLSATNAPLYIFWTTVCVPLIWQLTPAYPVTLAAGMYMLSFEIGWTLSTLIVLLVFVYSRKTLTNERVMKWVYRVVSIMMALLGVKMIFESLWAIGIF